MRFQLRWELCRVVVKRARRRLLREEMWRETGWVEARLSE